MLLIKCPQCQASYRLAESLYRRKAAGYGVVITCRHCKTQIHVDEGDEKTTVGDGANTASENEVTPARGPTVSGTPTPAKTAASAPRAPAAHEDTADAALAALPEVAPKPMAPRPAVAPRLVASPPRRGGTLLGIAPPGNTPAPTTVESGEDGWKPKLVALSPGLLGVENAAKPAAAKPAAAKPSPAARPAPAAPPPPPPVPPAPDEAETAADSIVPISSSSVELIESLPPDSAVPLDSSDYLSTPYAPPSREDDDDKTLVFAPATLKAKDKRAPHPPAPHPPAPHPPAPHPPTKQPFPESSDEEPTTARAPKVREPELDSSPLPLNQKKTAKAPKRPESAERSDELLGNDMSFGAAPALAPPDANALLRAPVSVRPAASDTRSPSSTKAPVSSSAGTQEKKGAGRGIAIVLVMAAFGGIGYALQHRALTKPAAEPNAVTTQVAEPAPPPPLDTATATAEASAAMPEASASAPVASAEPAKEATPVAAPPTTGTTTTPSGGTPAAGSTKAEKTSKVARETPPATTTTSEPTPTREPPAPKSSEPSAAPTPAVVEPRGSVGTDPFDVAAARAALDASAAAASSCRKEGDPSGVAVVTITFSQTGRVTTATISGPPFQATLTGGCIASTMRKTRVPAFAGDMVTVRKTVTIQ